MENSAEPAAHKHPALTDRFLGSALHVEANPFTPVEVHTMHTMYGEEGSPTCGARRGKQFGGIRMWRESSGLVPHMAGN
jgi:hypothetical protein